MSLAYGIHAVLEALKSGRVEKVCVERGQKNPRIGEILDLCRQKHVPFSLEERAWLDRKSGGERHQGAICYISEMPVLGVEEVLAKALARSGLQKPRRNDLVSINIISKNKSFSFY